ncbi:hypothetical protein LDENG_00017070 [Lucifuga dentata]|nr:hypothetical protein LDENG_00017070 [Lucifuga dentata]
MEADSTIESVLSSCIHIWFGNCNAFERKALQRVVRTAEKIMGTPLSSIQDIFSKRCLSRTISITKDFSHPHHGLFALLPSGK